MEITKKMYELAKLIVSEYEKMDLKFIDGFKYTKLSNLNKTEMFFRDASGTLYDCNGVKINEEFETIKLESLDKDKFDNEATVISEKSKKALKPHKNDYTTSVIDCYEKCLIHFPIDLRPTKMSEEVKWLDEIDKLNRLDHLQFSDIILLTKCAREDKFWSKNFLTLRKLRRKNKDGIPHWKLFRENFKFEKSKTQEVQSAYEQAKERLGL